MESSQHGLFGKMSSELSAPIAERTSGSCLPKLHRSQGGAVSIPRPPAGNSDTLWKSAGAIVGDGWSLAWRVLDAQYWGVPQRRKRIFLVADFGGERARQILFKPESLPGNIGEGGAAWKAVAGKFKNGPGATSKKAIPINTQVATRHKALGERTGLGVGNNGDPAYTLQENHSHAVCLILNDQGGARINVKKNNVSPCLRSETHGHPPLVLENHPNDSRIKIKKDGVVQTLSSHMGTGGGNVPLIFEPGIASRDGGHIWQNDVAPSLRATPGDNLPAVCLSTCCIRRLTPTECERLQGFPDGWTAFAVDGKKIPDSVRYKALGNSVAVPCVEYIMGNIQEAG